jgi:hypothetical protein
MSFAGDLVAFALSATPPLFLSFVKKLNEPCSHIRIFFLLKILNVLQLLIVGVELFGPTKDSEVFTSPGCW